MAEERYVLERQLGTGGMGNVWLATDTLLNRPVAVKFLQATNDAMHKDLFLSEARTLARLQHPNITLIYDAVFDEDENRYYIMMEYVEGKTLTNLIEEADGPLPFDSVINLTIGMLQALKYAHNKGLVHRDIKPDNIVIQEGVVKLTDFGLAELVSILEKQDDDNLIVGTPAYMSPEQIAGESLDGRADLYALGVVLFEMVTGGRRPFESNDHMQLLTAHIEEEARSAREFEPTVPLTIDRIISRLLSKFPDDRYPSAQTLLDIFQAFQARRKFSQHHLELVETSRRALIGRQAELKQLNAIWDDVQATGRSRLLVVSGEAGIGKQRLLTGFLGSSVVDKGMAAAVGRCDEVGAAYTPFAEILATIFDLGLVTPGTIESQIDYLTHQIPSLASLLNIESSAKDEPALPASGSGLWATLSNRLPAATLRDPRQAQQQFFTTVLNIFTELGPTVILLDDANYLDEASVALCRSLIRQSQAPILIVAKLKGSTPWVETFSTGETEFISLPPLPANHIKTYLVDFLEGDVSDALVRVVEKQSRGVPLKIEEVTHQLVEIGDFYQNESGQWEYQPPPVTGNLSQALLSPTLSGALTRRLEKLSPESKERLIVAALLEPGPEFNFDTWVAFLGQAPAQKALDEALHHRIIREIGKSQFAFRPADIATALTAELSPDARRSLHKKIAGMLVKHNTNPLLVAHHYEQAGHPTESARFLEAAGNRAIAANNVKQAVDCYKRATTLVGSVSGYEVLGNLHRQKGDWEESRAAFAQAIELAASAKDVEQQARVLNGMVFTLWLSDQYRDAAQTASTVLKLKGVSVLERATAQSHLGMISWLLGHLIEAENWCRKAVGSLINSSEEAKLAEAYNRLGLVFFTRGKFPEAADVTRLSLKLRRKLKQRWGEAYCLVGLGQIETDQGNFEAAEKHFNAARKIFNEIDSSDGLMVVDTEQGRSMLLQEQVSEAILVIGRALRRALKLDKRSSYGLGDIHLLIAQASLQLGDFERAKSEVQEALKLVEPAGNQKYIAIGQAIKARIFANAGDVILSTETFKQALTQFEEIDYPAGLLRTRLIFAQFLAGQGQNKTAADIEKRTRTAAARIGLFLSDNG